jgi:hypothetical protein
MAEVAAQDEASTSVALNDIYSDYASPSYEFSAAVKDFQLLPRFGHGSDFTILFTSNPNEQVDYAAGLIALFVFLLLFFVFWMILILTLKVMGSANSGFLSGQPFMVPNKADDNSRIRKRPGIVRLIFLVATGFVMLSSYLFVGMGLTNVNNATMSMSESLQEVKGMLEEVEGIARNLEEVGNTSIDIRDAAISELDSICPANPNIGDLVGFDIMAIANDAKDDLTMLADFIKEGLVTLDETLILVRDSTDNASSFMHNVNFWGWQMKLVAAGLFMLPAFFGVGVGLVMLNRDVKPYQMTLSYILLPLFIMTIIACCVVCCLILPFAATVADACSGGGDIRGGPDDSVLTIYRNLRGDDTGLIFQFVAFYTQQCNPKYYPFDFLSTYLSDLDTALVSTKLAVDAVKSNRDLLEEQCGRSFDSILAIMKDMDANLNLLEEQVVRSLDLVKCEDINRLYVDTFHEAGCTYSVDALGWVFASSLLISVCGLMMIMLRAAYYPVKYLELGGSWMKSSYLEQLREKHGNSTEINRTKSGDSDDEDDPPSRSSPTPMFDVDWSHGGFVASPQEVKKSKPWYKI